MRVGARTQYYAGETYATQGIAAVSGDIPLYVNSVPRITYKLVFEGEAQPGSFLSNSQSGSTLATLQRPGEYVGC